MGGRWVIESFNELFHERVFARPVDACGHTIHDQETEKGNVERNQFDYEEMPHYFI